MGRKLIIAAAIASTAIAGCGSSKSKTESEAGLKTKANAICKEVTTEIKSAENDGNYDKIIVLGNDAIARLKALKAPDKLKSDYSDYVAKQQATINAAEPIVAALKAKDKAKVQKFAAVSDKLNATSDTAAAKIGLTECAKNG